MRAVRCAYCGELIVAGRHDWRLVEVEGKFAQSHRWCGRSLEESVAT